MLERKEYLDFLIKLKDKKIIKVVTGIRRCGKSTLLTLYKKYLLETIKDNYPKYIITLDYDGANYNGIKQINAIDFLLGRVEI